MRVFIKINFLKYAIKETIKEKVMVFFIIVFFFRKSLKIIPKMRKKKKNNFSISLTNAFRYEFLRKSALFYLCESRTSRADLPRDKISRSKFQS